MLQRNTQQANRAIRQVRDLLGMSQEQFAMKIKASKVTLRAYEHGRRSVNAQVADLLAKEYGILRTTLLQNDKVRVLMWNGKPATKQAINAWKNLTPSAGTIEDLAERAELLAGRLFRELKNSRKGALIDALVRFSQLIEEAKLADGAPETHYMTQRWSDFCDWVDAPLRQRLGTEERVRNISAAETVSITHSVMDLPGSLLMRSLEGDGRREHLDVIRSAKKYEITVRRRGGEVIQLVYKHYVMSSLDVWAGET